MRLRSLLVLAALTASLPVGIARAHHCDSNIYLFTATKMPAGPYDGAVVLTSSASCNAATDEEANTDVIYPGMDYWQVRWGVQGVDVKPSRASVAFAGKTYALTFTRGVNFLMEPNQPWWDSQWFHVDTIETAAGNTATVEVCIEDEEGFETCETRPYRTVA